MPPPIGPRLHGAIDYGFIILQALAPSLFKLHGPAKTLCYVFACNQALLNSLTDQPYALKKVVPFRVHGQLERPMLPALLVAPYITGALKQRNARRFFVGFFALALTNYLLTDYKAQERQSGFSQKEK
ncbi:hypothetical protein MTX78_23465 (plasmid) [Hymenobacter tibetensis]|uniref:Uncharacterized protein n=1 Tax=Hymenobacter tibetensis TaxID=497967 RepID=A0ABY4D4K5_9BACT|nr:hypothetical protein [Hymenobacter tibetensis]UOG77308.1 hypothetical protein MTX78_23465 [Hymenobacter tibetensis]